ncbi:MAG: VanZ family protein [Mollicutes bacterium]|nr:VanZ family protein [Mollicutes bacterium]
MFKGILRESFKYSLPSLIIILIAIIAVRIAYCIERKKKIYIYREYWNLFAICYLILFYDLVTRVDINTYSGVNLIPFAEIFRYSFESKMFYYNVMGNIIMFIPFGFIVATYLKPKKIWPHLTIGFIVSLTIESVQRNIGRSFDIDDILLNTIGCVIGYILYLLFIRIYKKLPLKFKTVWFNNLFCLFVTVIIGVIIIFI